MIQVKEFPKQQFTDKEALFKALKDNKSVLIAQKKSQTKEADAFTLYPLVSAEQTSVKEDLNELLAIKAISPVNPSEISTLKMDLGINTTNLFDSHNDVHLPGLWNKSLKEKRDLYLLKEHSMSFENIITDDVKGMTKYVPWKELGADYEGKTQVLVFRVKVEKERHGFMFEQYAKAYVKNHSVGMRYVHIKLGINSEEEYFEQEKEIWDKYIDAIVNKEMAEANGFFWAVLEAKVIEGSAVPMGSNWVTPVMSMESKEAGIATSTDTEADIVTSDPVASFYKNLL